ncbi:MAG: heparinase II/III family protein [Roseinatronobacter sp.]
MTAALGTQPVSLTDRLVARVLARVQAPQALVVTPDPRGTGGFARGQQMLAGNFLMAGELVQALPGSVPFEATTPAAVDALHGFDWLDDLAAVGDRAARALAQKGLVDWLAACRKGQGPGWTPGLVGRRLINWLSHAVWLMQTLEKPMQDRFLRALAHHGAFLARRAHRAPAGMARIDAQAGLLHASVSLQGWEALKASALRDLLASGQALVGSDGSIPSRNPEELLHIFARLAWAARLIVDQGGALSQDWLDLLGRCAGALRVLRHADGGLARFHGGGRGNEAELIAALGLLDRLSSGQMQPPAARAMGYARLAAGRVTVLIDAAPPPAGEGAGTAHASTLSFELTSNRRPVIVSCGDGRPFGADWQRASRASASHSVLSLDGFSSSRFGGGDRARLNLTDGPQSVGCEFRHSTWSRVAAMSHDGYLASHGLEHLRYLDLSADGRILTGEDMLVAAGKSGRKRFDDVRARAGEDGVPFSVRFHLHPDLEASVDMNGTAVSVVLRSGEVWVFRADGLPVTLAPSVYLEKGRLKPRPSLQIVLSLRTADYTTQVNWTFQKAQETPLAVRDTAERDLLDVPDL